MPRSNAPTRNALDKLEDSLPYYEGHGQLRRVNFQMLRPGDHLVWRSRNLGTITNINYSLDGSYISAIETESGTRLTHSWASRALRRVV